MVLQLDEEAQARADVWKYAFAYVNTRVVKCAVELEIPDILEKHGGPMSLADLSAAVGCPSAAIYRIMRFLIYHGIFKKIKQYSGNENTDESPETVHYVQTPLSRYLTRDEMAPFILIHPPLPAGISVEALRTGKHPKVKADAGEDTWTDPAHGNHDKRFTDAMASHARVTMSAMIENYAGDGLKGIKSLVDVGGRHGMALGVLVEAFPAIKGICYDLPEIASKAPPRPGIEFVGGSMFESVPKADAVMLMWVLHDWSDKLCIEILKKCKEAVPAETGKVIIVDAVIDEEGEGDEYREARLALDMVMMDVTVNGKERTYKEWAYLLNAAGFRKHSVKNIKTIESVIEAYP